MEKREPVLVVGNDITVRVEVRNDCPPGMAYLVGPASVTQADPETGELKYPFAVAKIQGI